MPARLSGPTCERGCGRPVWKDGFCSPCWRAASPLERMMAADEQMVTDDDAMTRTLAEIESLPTTGEPR